MIDFIKRKIKEYQKKRNAKYKIMYLENMKKHALISLSYFTALKDEKNVFYICKETQKFIYLGEQINENCTCQKD